jgi:flagellar biosynthesis regulator FlbT
MSVQTENQNVMIAYHQGCIKASRKVVLPIIQKAVYEHENDILLTDKSNTAPTVHTMM